jgi:uncharacterized membrane protein YbhN (UPF0104 family)
METPTAERSRAATIFNIVMMAVGGIALYFMLRHLGWTELRAMLTNVGWWFAVVLALELAALCMDGAALHAFMRPEARMISYWRVLASNMSGRAINVLTPGGALGEPIKLMLLSAHAPRARALSSLVLFNLTIAYVAVTMMLIGIPITLLALDLPHGVKVMVGVGLAVIVPAMIALGVVVRRGATRSVVDLLERVRIIKKERADTWREKLVETDKHIRELHKNRSAGTWKGILWVLGSKVVSWSSSIVLIAAVGVEITPTLVIGVLSVGLLLGWISQVVPMGLGVQDGGNYALFGLLGATGPQGLLVAMLQRARSISVAILGLGAYATLQIINRFSQTKIQKKIVELREQHGEPATEPVTEPAPATEPAAT